MAGETSPEVSTFGVSSLNTSRIYDKKGHKETWVVKTEPAARTDWTECYIKVINFGIEEIKE